MNRAVHFLAFLAAVALMTGCATKRLGPDYTSRHGVTVPVERTRIDAKEIRVVAVIPFAVLPSDPGDEPGRSLGDPLTGFSFVPGPVGEEASDTVTMLATRQLAERGVTVIPEEQAAEALTRFADIADPAARAAAVAADLGADAAVTGTVLRYVDKVGGKLAADRPASVAFSLAVITAGDGKITWKGRFDKEQRPLFEDMTDIGSFVKGGMVWQSVDELAALGMESLVKVIPLPHARP